MAVIFLKKNVLIRRPVKTGGSKDQLTGFLCTSKRGYPLLVLVTSRFVNFSAMRRGAVKLSNTHSTKCGKH